MRTKEQECSETRRELQTVSATVQRLESKSEQVVKQKTYVESQLEEQRNRVREDREEQKKMQKVNILSTFFSFESSGVLFVNLSWLRAEISKNSHLREPYH